MTQKRYSVTAEFYIFADNPKDLEKKCKAIQEQYNKDNDGAYFHIKDDKYNAPFGCIQPEKIEKF